MNRFRCFVLAEIKILDLVLFEFKPFLPFIWLYYFFLSIVRYKETTYLVLHASSCFLDLETVKLFKTKE